MSLWYVVHCCLIALSGFVGIQAYMRARDYRDLALSAYDRGEAKIAEKLSSKITASLVGVACATSGVGLSFIGLFSAAYEFDSPSPRSAAFLAIAALLLGCLFSSTTDTSKS